MRVKPALLLCVAALNLNAQGWPQWGQNPAHTGAVSVAAQKLDQVLAQFTYDPLADQIRQDEGGELLVHYMAPLVDGSEIFTFSRGNSQWISCRNSAPPCGTQRWGQMAWGVSKLDWPGSKRSAAGPRRIELQATWTAISSWKPVPDNGSSWEQVFHPVLAGGFLYMPGDAGSVLKVDRRNGQILATLQPFDGRDLNRFVTSPLSVDAAGSIYYTVMKLDAAQPWTADVSEAWLVKIDVSGQFSKTTFPAMLPGILPAACITSFGGESLPWPPAPTAKAPVAPCGGLRPALNAAPAVAPDGTVYVIARAHFNSSYGYLVALNSDLSTKWSASLRGLLNDGCDVLLPPSGTVGGCRAGSARGVDPATNELPAGIILDQATASPVVAPDGSILYGAYTRYNYARGHLFRFSASGTPAGTYDFGWDITPAVSKHGSTWSVIVKDNFYSIGSYCSVPGFCGQAKGHFSITSLGPDLRPEWTYTNTNDQLCERQPDGVLACQTASEGFEWCVNMVAVDGNGVSYANSEDGNVYAFDRTGKLAGRIFLKVAIGAAYTPLAIGGDGLIYTQNDGTLFIIGNQPDRTIVPVRPR